MIRDKIRLFQNYGAILSEIVACWETSSWTNGVERVKGVEGKNVKIKPSKGTKGGNELT